MLLRNTRAGSRQSRGGAQAASLQISAACRDPETWCHSKLPVHKMLPAGLPATTGWQPVLPRSTLRNLRHDKNLIGPRILYFSTGRVTAHIDISSTRSEERRVGKECRSTYAHSY